VCKILLILLIVLFSLFTLPFSFAQEGNFVKIESTKAGLKEGLGVYGNLKNLELDETKVAEVESLTLKRDVGIFHLKRGKIYLAKPVLDKVTGAVFVGDGIFEFSPPTQIEKYQLEKFTQNKSLNRRFSELYLRFTDKTFEELEKKLKFLRVEIEGKAKEIKQSSEKRIFKVLGENINNRVLEDLLSDGSSSGETDLFSGFFFADINSEEDRRLFFSYDPKNTEEVMLLRESLGKLGHEYDVVCSFHKESDYRDTPFIDTEEDKEEIKTTHYKMEVKLESSGNLDASCELAFVPLVEGIRVISFELDTVLKVSQVKDGDDSSLSALSFIREKDQNELTVILPYPLQAGKEKKLLFRYSGKIMDRTWYGDFFIKETTWWFPRYGYFPKATFDLTFKTPKDYKFVSVGKKEKEWIQGDTLFSHWIEDFPSSFVSFNFGAFQIYKQKAEDLPEVEVYFAETAHRKFNQDNAEYMVPKGGHMKENIAADVLSSLNFFQKSFGKYPFDYINATEIPAFYGQSFPGFLHLGWLTFQEEEKFKEESFKAHEVSHQWWGHIIGWKTYHDQWLSEGFAEYSGAWFAQLSLKDNQRFFGQLKSWEEDILGEGYKQSQGSKAGPLWLGHRLSSSKSEDYETLVYKKGAFVLHMLRNMMMDFSTHSDDKFTEMLKDYVKTYYGENASTEDFKKIVDKHFGEDMSWFFDQWVYGIEIPKYVYSYSVDKVDGEYQVTLKVKQENVSSSFKMPVPVVVVFKDEGYSIFMIMVDKPLKEIKLPLVSKEVKDIVFNPFHSVLAEVEKK
jgi:hypothetical protein